MVFVKVSQTYDLSTKVGKMGLIGIHTPPISLINQMWGGLMKNHRYMRLDKCDVVVACASTLPADPLQVGVEEGSIAPQDMFNPILYTATSNDSFNTIVNRIYGGSHSPFTYGSLTQGELPSEFDSDDNFAIYYSLLAEGNEYRKALPQQGLEMKGLYPIVYQVVNTFGNQKPLSQLDNIVNNGVPVPGDDTSYGEQTIKYTQFSMPAEAGSFRGPSMRMPRIPTSGPSYSNYVDADSDMSNPDMAYGPDPITTQNEFPRTYVAALITPPAKLSQFYFRMKITWTIEFSELMPNTERAGYYGMLRIARQVYGSDYEEQSKKMETKTEMVDSHGTDVELVMESTR